MANFALRTVVATTLEVIHADNGYIAPIRNATTNTQTKVLATLKRTPTPQLDPEYWQFADEMIGFFRILDTLPDYKKILETPDGSLYQTCVNTAKSDEITPLTFPYAVTMPNLYSKLKPQKPKKLNPLKSEAKIIKPGEYMGVLNQEDRFFVKLMRVGDHDPTRGGTLFVVNDRSGNNGFFYEKPDKLEGVIQLGDCFAIHATPTRHSTADNGEKHTVFRSVQVLKDTIVPGKAPVDGNNDSTGGKFTKNVPF
jgi:hypothetical protein